MRTKVDVDTGDMCTALAYRLGDNGMTLSIRVPDGDVELFGMGRHGASVLRAALAACIEALDKAERNDSKVGSMTVILGNGKSKPPMVGDKEEGK